MDIEKEELQKRIIELENENEKLKKSLENYNNSRKSYYEKNKETIKEKALARLKKLSEENPEKIKNQLIVLEKNQLLNKFAATHLEKSKKKYLIKFL